MNTEFSCTPEEMLMDLALEAVKWAGRDATAKDIEVDNMSVVAWLHLNGGIAAILMMCNETDRKQLQWLLCEVMYGGSRSETIGKKIAEVGAPIARRIMVELAARKLPTAVEQCIANGTLGRYRKLTETGELK